VGGREFYDPVMEGNYLDAIAARGCIYINIQALISNKIYIVRDVGKK
jgi:hypothetical protein